MSITSNRLQHNINYKTIKSEEFSAEIQAILATVLHMSSEIVEDILVINAEFARSQIHFSTNDVMNIDDTEMRIMRKSKIPILGKLLSTLKLN